MRARESERETTIYSSDGRNQIDIAFVGPPIPHTLIVCFQCCKTKFLFWFFDRNGEWW